MASDMAGLVATPRYKNRVVSGFPARPDNIEASDLGGFPAYTQNPYFSKTSTLLHFDGVDNSTSIVDTAPIPKSYTINGNAKISTNRSAFGGSSLLCDGSGAFLTTPIHTDFQVGSLDYTLAAFVTPLANNDGTIFMRGQYTTTTQTWDPGFGIRRMSDTLIRFYFNTTTLNATEQKFDYTATTSIGVRYHLAMVVKSSIGYAFVDGKLVGSLAGIDPVNDSSAGVSIGKFPYNASPLIFNGYIDELFLVKGAALWTSDFRVQTTALSDF